MTNENEKYVISCNKRGSDAWLSVKPVKLMISTRQHLFVLLHGKDPLAPLLERYRHCDMGDEIDVAKLKVPELRAELGRRGLNTFGTKQILMDRLNEALNKTGQGFVNSGQLTASEMGPGDEPPCITSPIPVKNSVSENSEVETRHNNENGFATEVSHESDVDHRQREQDPPKRKRSPSRSPKRRSRSRERESRRSPRRRSRSPGNKIRIPEEALDWEKSLSVFLDGYNCDLNLIIDTGGYAAKPQTEGGFSLMWAGVRANYGIVSGKTFYEVRILKNLNVESFDSLAGGATHVLRLGWSTESADFALGEEPNSYGYGGTGRKSCNNKFENYGCTFAEGDVVGAFIDYTPTEAVLRFSVNGVDQGECYRVQKSALGDHHALFPHIYVKNVEFAVNFGQDNQTPWFSPAVPGDDPVSWKLMDAIDTSHKVHGRLPPASKAECEVIMMVGLPGSGKTYYADHYRADNREKMYNVLGTNLILDKMKVLGLARQRNYHGRWDVLIDKATKCLNILINVASMRRRNYILDQTNVYPSAQRRKMRPFEGFKRKAIVIVPTDEEFRRRIAQRGKEEGKEVPESAVLEMKANFGIPKPVSEDSSSVFDEVIFTELQGDEAKALVQQYNQEGQSSRPPPEKRQKWDGNREREGSGSRDSRFRSYDSRDQGHDFGGRSRRDDFRRSPNRRDDRGRRDYRGGYSASRDRSRDDDRYSRSRDRDSYSRPQGGRFGGPRGRYDGPGRGSFGPGPGGYGGYDGPRGGSMMRGRGGPPGPMDRGGYGGRGFDGFRGGRGGYRGGAPERGGYNGPADSGYGGRFDGPKGDGMPPNAPGQGAYDGGGYRGGYAPRGGPMGRGSVPSRDGGPTGRGGRGAAQDRGGPGGRGRGGPGAGRGDRDPATGYYDQNQSYYGSYEGTGADAYSGQDAYAGAGDDYRNQNPDQYADSSSYGTPAAAKGPTGGYSDGYQRNVPPPYAAPATGAYPPSSTGPYGSTNAYPAAAPGGYGPPGSTNPSTYPGATSTGYPGGASAYTGGYSSTGSDNYGATTGQTGPDASGTRGGRPGSRPANATANSTRAYGENDHTSTTQGDGSSLYASGAARYGDTRHPGTTQSSGPRQSRFDSKSPNATSAQTPYSGYPSVSGYQGGFNGSYTSSNTSDPPASTAAPNTNAVSSTRTGRTRFDVGPGTQGSTPSSTLSSTTPTQAGRPPIPAQSQPTTQQPQATAQAYGYGYGGAAAAAPKADTTSASTNQAQPATNQTGYGAYGYGYGYGAYPTQATQATTNRSGDPSATQSLYASAVAAKPQQTSNPSAPSGASTAAQSDPSSAAAAYASYYYGASASQTAGKYDAAMVAAQQFNAWQQPPAAASSTASSATTTAQSAAPAAGTNPYASYYPGYSTYAAAGYGAAPVAPAAAAGTGTAPQGTAPASQPMSQYYAGYR